MKSDFFDGRYRKMFQPWNLSGGLRQNEPEAYGAYEQGHVDGTLHARYSTMLGSGSRDTTRRFSGKRTDYPMFRQQLLRDFHLLWESDPYILLQKIANSVTDPVYEHIKSARVVRDPREGLNQIWSILEDLYGDPRGLLDNAIRDIKWDKESISSKVSSLQMHRTKLCNLKCIAESINMSSELNRPKLLFRIVECFCPFLFTQFMQKNQDYTVWQFTTIMKFLDEQIVNLQFKEGHTYDISTIISEDKSNKKPQGNFAERYQNVRTNSMQAASSELCDPSKGKQHSTKQDNQEASGRSNYHQRKKPPEGCAIHSTQSHATIECRQFLEKNEEQRSSSEERGYVFIV